MSPLFRSARMRLECAIVLAVAGFISSCVGTIGDLPGEEEGAAPRDPESAGYTEDPAGLYDRPAPSPRVARLTHSEWKNTVRDLLRLDDAAMLTFDFRPDPAQQGFLFDTDVTTLSVDDALFGSYQRAAVDLAALVTGDPSLLSDLLPAGVTNDEAGARAFIEEFGRRAHRRPLEAEAIDEYLALYRGAAGAYTGLDDFTSGIRLLLEAFLQSPYVLYRIERSTAASAEVIPLDGWEIASRLSYMLWDTMPDDALFAAAESGELLKADTVAAEAIRMLEDPRAESVVLRFHEQLLDVDRFDSISPSTAFFPNVSADLGAFATQEEELFVRGTLMEQSGGFRDLLLSTETFANAELARIYGLSGSYDEQFVKVSLDPAQRKGLLTQTGFLASHASSVNPEPIHRGVFVAKRILCTTIGAPPGTIPPLPPPEGRTNRETVEDHTEAEGSVCATCHKTIINPLGFPFENYDAIGAYRTLDNGLPVDATSTPVIDGQPVPVQNALELLDAIAESTSAHECYTRHWIEFSYGRAEADQDESLVQRLGEGSRDGTLSVKDLIIGLVKTEAFLTRSLEELP